MKPVGAEAPNPKNKSEVDLMIPKPFNVKLSDGRVRPGARESVRFTDAIPDPEEYRIVLEEDEIRIEARTETGVFYARQTLKQLALDFGGALPIGEISDKPAYSYRGLMLDPARHFLPLERLYRIVDDMAFYKLNRLHLHLTDDQGWRVEIKKYPLLTEKGAIRAGTQSRCDGTIEKKPYGEGLYYRQEDLKSFVAYARARGVEIVPEIDMPGHLLAAIHVCPALACGNPTVNVRESWGVEDVIACAGKPEIYEFARNVFAELAEIFPYGYFHIGGDEVPKTKWKTCPDCQRVMRENGWKDENALQGFFNLKIAKILAEFGKKPVLWHENLGTELPHGAYLQIWRAGSDETAARAAAKSGGVIVSRGEYFYFDYPYLSTPLNRTYGFDAQKIGLPDDAREKIVGVEGTLWSEWIRDAEKFEFNLYPRMQALAEVGWTRERGGYADFLRRLKPHLSRMDETGVCYCPLKLADPGAIRRGILYRRFYRPKSDWTAELRYFRKKRGNSI